MVRGKLQIMKARKAPIRYQTIDPSASNPVDRYAQDAMGQKTANKEPSGAAQRRVGDYVNVLSSLRASGGGRRPGVGVEWMQVGGGSGISRLSVFRWGGVVYGYVAVKHRSTGTRDRYDANMKAGGKARCVEWCVGRTIQGLIVDWYVK